MNLLDHHDLHSSKIVTIQPGITRGVIGLRKSLDNHWRVFFLGDIGWKSIFDVCKSAPFYEKIIISETGFDLGVKFFMFLKNMTIIFLLTTKCPPPCLLQLERPH